MRSDEEKLLIAEWREHHGTRVLAQELSSRIRMHERALMKACFASSDPEVRAAYATLDAFKKSMEAVSGS